MNNDLHIDLKIIFKIFAWFYWHLIFWIYSNNMNKNPVNNSSGQCIHKNNYNFPSNFVDFGYERSSVQAILFFWYTHSLSDKFLEVCFGSLFNGISTFVDYLIPKSSL